MSWIKVLFTALLGITSTTAWSQSSQDIKFAQYLINKKYYDEAIYSLGNYSKKTLSVNQKDSVLYLLGNIYYNQQKLDSSILKFDLVSNHNMRLHSESVFFSAFNEAYLKRFSVSEKKLLAFQTSDSTLQTLKNFELAGVQLLQRNFYAFDSMAGYFNERHFVTAKQQTDLINYRSILKNFKKKKAYKAGLLSAVIPGAGKFYAGYRGQGFFNFIVAGLLGLQAWEGYKKAGPESFRFIAYSTLFTSFYISNIWGSTLAVKIKRNEISNAVDAQILFAMHIPIRSTFH